MPKKHHSNAFPALPETMEAMHEIGAIDKQTMREFDEACLTQVQLLEPDENKELRLPTQLIQRIRSVGQFQPKRNAMYEVISVPTMAPTHFSTAKAIV